MPTHPVGSSRLVATLREIAAWIAFPFVLVAVLVWIALYRGFSED